MACVAETDVCPECGASLKLDPERATGPYGPTLVCPEGHGLFAMVNGEITAVPDPGEWA